MKSATTYKIKSAIFCAAVLAAAIIILLFSRENTTPSVTDGHYLFDGSDAYSYSVTLAGDWEFYPDTLIYSEPEGELPEAQYATLPDRWIQVSQHTLPETGNASYRLIIDDFNAFAGKSNIVLSMTGFLQNYQIFVNGKQLSTRIPSPTGYQLYAIDGEGTTEIVIELQGSTTGLTIAPELSAIGVHIGNIDSTRNIIFIVVTLFLILFLMFFLFSLSQETHLLRPMTILGFLTTALFLINSIGSTGYIDSVNKFCSNNVLSLICMLLRLVIIGWGIYSFHIYFPNVLNKLWMQICEGLITLAISAYIILPVLLHLYAGWYFIYALIFAAIIIWCFFVVRGICYKNSDCLEPALILLASYTATCMTFIYDWIPNNVFIILALPAAIICNVILSFVSYYKYQHEALARTKKLLELERYASQTQMAMLSSQIQPHFLYNTLLTIQELCMTNPAEASRVIVRFSNYIRHNIDFMNYAELIPFGKEEDHIENFMYIQEVRFQDKLSYEADIQVRDFMIPPLSVQPLLENAIKYGVRSKLDGGYARLKVYENAAGIHIVVSNSGMGFDKDKLRAGHSLENIRTRLASLLNAQLIINSKEDREGTSIEIFIPSDRIRRTSDIVC